MLENTEFLSLLKIHGNLNGLAQNDLVYQGTSILLLDAWSVV